MFETPAIARSRVAMLPLGFSARGMAFETNRLLTMLAVRSAMHDNLGTTLHTKFQLTTVFDVIVMGDVMLRKHGYNVEESSRPPSLASEDDVQ
jgi:hypothetical protein